MRFHIFKSSPAKNLIISSSQTRHLYFPNFNILSLPGGKTRDIIPFIPTAEEYNIIGGNDLFEGNVPSTSSPKEVAEEIKLAADKLTLVANKVFVIGIPHRHNQPERTKAVNKILSSFKAKWSFRGISHNIYAEYHLEKDEVQLSDFWTQWPEVNSQKQGPLQVLQCRSRRSRTPISNQVFKDLSLWSLQSLIRLVSQVPL